MPPRERPSLASRYTYFAFQLDLPAAENFKRRFGFEAFPHKGDVTSAIMLSSARITTVSRPDTAYGRAPTLDVLRQVAVFACLACFESSLALVALLDFLDGALSASVVVLGS